MFKEMKASTKNQQESENIGKIEIIGNMKKI